MSAFCQLEDGRTGQGDRSSRIKGQCVCKCENHYYTVYIGTAMGCPAYLRKFLCAVYWDCHGQSSVIAVHKEVSVFTFSFKSICHQGGKYYLHAKNRMTRGMSFTDLPCSSSSSSFENTKLTNHRTNERI